MAGGPLYCEALGFSLPNIQVNPVLIFFFSFAFTLRFQFPLRIWWSSVGHPCVHKVSLGVLLVMAISLLSMPDGSCMSVLVILLLNILQFPVVVFIVRFEPLSRNESGKFGALKSNSTHHFFRNACTKSGSLRFSQFSGC